MATRADDETRDLIRSEVQAALKPALDNLASMSVIVSDLNDHHNKAIRTKPAAPAAPGAGADLGAVLNLVQSAEDRGASRTLEVFKVASEMFKANSQAMMEGIRLAGDLRRDVLNELDEQGVFDEPEDDELDLAEITELGEHIKKTLKRPAEPAAEGGEE